MLANLYSFFFEWLFGSTVPTWMSAQGVEFTCIVFSIIVMVFVLWLATLPIRLLFSYMFR